MSAETNGAKQFIWVVAHTHNHGTSIYLLRADRDPTEEEVIALFDIDYEGPEVGEDLELTRFGADEIPTLPPKT